jgi:hypothetical protein
MTMKLEEFLALKQGEHPVMHYVGRFNHLSQYAIEYVNTDKKKKNNFLRGLNTKLQTMMTTCGNTTYHETINIAIASEENYRRHKEAKKKKIFASGSSSGKRQKIIYHPQNHGRAPFCPQQGQSRQQIFIHPATNTPYTHQAPQQQNNTNNVNRNATPQNHNFPCYNCGKPRHFS